jgi:hypothetical protein
VNRQNARASSLCASLGVISSWFLSKMKAFRSVARPGIAERNYSVLALTNISINALLQFLRLSFNRAMGTFIRSCSPMLSSVSLQAYRPLGRFAVHRILLVFFAVGLLSACGTSEYDWQRVHATNTLAAYQSFLANHPKSKQADLARGIILAMQDDKAWKTATKTQSKQSLDAYLAAYPGGLHANQARFDNVALDRAAAWKPIEHNVDFASLHAVLAQYPEGPESNIARKRVASMIFRAKFADSYSRAAADRQLERLESRLHEILHTLEIVPPSQGDGHYDVTSGLLSETAAHAACTAALRAHQRCQVVSDKSSSGRS